MDLHSVQSGSNDTEVVIDSASNEELRALDASCAVLAPLPSAVGERSEIESSGESIMSALEVFPTADLATDADSEYVQSFGGGAEANAEILAIVNGVDGIFKPNWGFRSR